MLSSHLLYHHLRHRGSDGREVGVIRVLVGGRDGRAVCLYLGHGMVSDDVLIDVPTSSCDSAQRVRESVYGGVGTCPKHPHGSHQDLV